MAADSINNMLRAAILSEIERLRERFYSYTEQRFGGLSDLFKPDLLEPDLLEPDLLKPDLLESDLLEPELSEPNLPADLQPLRQDDTPADAGSITEHTQNQKKNGGKALEDSAAGFWRDNALKSVQSLIRSYTQQITGRMKTAAQNLTGALELTVEKLIVSPDNASEITHRYLYGITGDNRLSVTSPPPEVNIYMTAAQQDEITAEAVRARLEELTRNVFGGDDFFSRMRPR